MATREEEKKARERPLLDKYLELRGITPGTVTAYDPPDFVVTADVDGKTTEIGIELCRYQIDGGNEGGAPSISRRVFHVRLNEALLRGGFDFTTLSVYLNYDERNAPRRVDVEPLAAEISQFRTQKESLVPTFHEDPSGCLFGKSEEHLDEFPLLRKYVLRIDLVRPFAPGDGQLGYNDSAGSRLPVPVGSIRNSLRKHRVAKWPDQLRRLPLKWLVICAGVETAHDIIGPNLGTVTQPLDALASEAAECGFDLVTFWESRAGWEHPIWHSGLI